MIIHISVPRFWIVVEEQRRPDLQNRPVVIASSFLQKTAARSTVLMANEIAETHGVQKGMALSHARHLCPEAVILNPEMPLYDGVWDDVMALLLTYTPLVESPEPGEAACDVSGCERLFGDPVFLAREIVHQIGVSAGFLARAGVASNRLVAQLAASLDGGSHETRIAVVPAGQEADFLAPLPVNVLPEIDPGTLLSFQVLGLKRVGDLALISEPALESRFGPLGRRLARYARGRDDRPVRPAPEMPALKVTRICDDDADGLEPEQVLSQLIDRLASDLSSRLREKHLAGRLLMLMLKAPRRLPERSIHAGDHVEQSLMSSFGAQISEPEQFFPNQDSRIHSMLPQPRQPGSERARGLSASQGGHGQRPGTDPRTESLEQGASPETRSPTMVVKGIERMAASRPLDDRRSLTELANRLLLRMLSRIDARNVLSEPGIELQLEMRHFAPAEQMTLPGLDGRPVDVRRDRLHRQEAVLTSRFGATPFRHLAAIDLDTVLQERQFRWADGMER